TVRPGAGGRLEVVCGACAPPVVFCHVVLFLASGSGLAGVTGLEPATYGFGDRCAANCATPLSWGRTGRARPHARLVHGYLPHHPNPRPACPPPHRTAPPPAPRRPAP